MIPYPWRHWNSLQHHSVANSNIIYNQKSNVSRGRITALFFCAHSSNCGDTIVLSCICVFVLCVCCVRCVCVTLIRELTYNQYSTVIHARWSLTTTAMYVDFKIHIQTKISTQDYMITHQTQWSWKRYFNIIKFRIMHSANFTMISRKEEWLFSKSSESLKQTLLWQIALHCQWWISIKQAYEYDSNYIGPFLRIISIRSGPVLRLYH